MDEIVLPQSEQNKVEKGGTKCQNRGHPPLEVLLKVCGSELQAVQSLRHKGRQGGGSKDLRGNHEAPKTGRVKTGFLQVQEAKPV